MALNKVTGQVVLPTTDLTVGVLTVTNSVAIGGTLTYEDVTNIDSVGLITARQGISVTGGDVKIGSGVSLSVDGHSYHTGVITATKFVGDGSTLTNITSTTINNNADNRLITGSGTANTLEGEANLKYDGTRLDIDSSGQNILQLNSTHSDGPNVPLQRSGTTMGNLGSAAAITSGTATDFAIGATTNLVFANGGSEKVRIDSNGRLLQGLTSSRGNYGNNTSGVDYIRQIEGTSATSSTMTLVRNSADANDGGIIIGKTRNASVGGNTVVQAGDDLGTITWAGNDGTSMQFGAEITSTVETGVGNDDMPAALIFKTNGGTTSTTERMRIHSGGQITIGTPTSNSSDRLTILDPGTAFMSIRSDSHSDGNSQILDFGVGIADRASGNLTASIEADIHSTSGGTLKSDLKIFTNRGDSITESIRITSDGWLKYTGSTGADETNKLGRFLMPSHDTNEEDVQYFQMEQEGAFNQITIGGGSASYNSATNIVFRTSSAVDTTTGTSRWSIGTSGHLMPGANNTYEIGSNSIKVNKTWSNYWIHRHGSSSGVAQNEAEAIFIQGGLHFLHDNVTCSSASFTHGFTASRSYPTILVHQDGSGAAIHAEDGAITEASDYRIKDNVLPLESALDKVKTLRPISYTLKKSWKPSGRGEVYHGFIAHEVNQSLPGITGIVVGEKDALAPELYSEQDKIDGNIPDGKEVGDETGRTTNDMLIQSVDYGKLTPVLTAAIKELITKVSILESEVDRLKSS